MFERLKKWRNTKPSTETNDNNKQSFGIGTFFRKVTSFLKGLRPYHPDASDKMDLKGRDPSEVAPLSNIDVTKTQNVRIVDKENKEKANDLRKSFDRSEQIPPPGDSYYQEPASKSCSRTFSV